MTAFYLLLSLSLALVRIAFMIGGRRGVHLGDRALRVLRGQATRFPVVRIADAVEGTVNRVVGVGQPGDGWLVSPVSHKPCLIWRIELSVLEYTGDRRATTWRRIAELDTAQPFRLVDPSGECVVEPALATIGLATGAVTRFAGSQVPSDLLELLDRRGVAMELVHRSTVSVIERTLPIGVPLAVVGVARVAPRETTHERSYRDAQATWTCFDGSQADLLIGTDRELRSPRTRASGGPGATPWGLPKVVASGGALPAIDVDDFEAELHAGRKRRIGLAMLTGVAVVAGAVGAIHARSEPDDPVLTDAHRRELADAIGKTRGELDAATCGTVDGCWRRALSQRAVIAASDAPCDYERMLVQRVDAARSIWSRMPASYGIERAPFPVVVLAPGAALPATSPRRWWARWRLAVAEAALASARDASYAGLVDYTADAIEKIDLVIEIGTTPPARAWLYDHGLERIACAATIDLERPAGGSLGEVVRALHAVTAEAE